MQLAKKKFSFGGWLLIGLVVLIASQFNRPDTSTQSLVTSTARSSAPTFLPGTADSAPGQKPSTPAPSEIRFVTASSLNIRSSPSTSAATVAKIPNGTQIAVIEKRSGWLRVQTSTGQGWVSEQFTSTTRPGPVYRPPAPLLQTVPAAASGQSCSPRRTCGQIASCSAARWYLANCSWGGRLDRDSDGVPCETMCR
jgi:hypothetical protein